MKYRAKAADVDAIQVHFGTRSYPKWLEGKLTITTADELTGKGNSLVVRNGDYLVSDSGVVSIYGRRGRSLLQAPRQARRFALSSAKRNKV